MSYAVRRVADPSSAGSAPNGTAQHQPTTATVFDFICLFTHDLRRKQKRWQDGKLQYHTFNKRIVVHDDRGRFIGDAHWTMGGDLEPGEELELDRGAAIVQVADRVGSREQDLTDILDKRARDVEKRRAVAAAKTPSSTRRQETQPHFQLNHRPLSSIVPSPGPIGRAAIPQQSPFEARRAAAGDDRQPAAPPAKKRRVDISPPSKAGFAQNLFGAKLNLSASATSLSSLRSRALRETTNLRAVVLDAPPASRLSGEDNDVIMLDAGTRLKPSAKPETPTMPKNPLTKEFEVVEVQIMDEENDQPINIRHAKVATASSRRDATKTKLPSVLYVPKKPAELGQKVVAARRETAPHATRESEPSQRSARLAMGDDEDDLAEVTTEIRQSSPLAKQRRDVRQSMDMNNIAARERQKKARENGTVESEMPRRKAQHNPQGRRHQNQLEVSEADNTVEQAESTCKPRSKSEQRTELRIKSRKRRGLLMVSERKQDIADSAVATPVSSAAKAEEYNQKADDQASPDSDAEAHVIEAVKATPEPSSQPSPPSGQQANETNRDVDSRTNLKQSPQTRQNPVFAVVSSDSELPTTRKRMGNIRITSRMESPDPDEMMMSTRRRDITPGTSSDGASDNIPESSSSPPKNRSTRRKQQRTESNADKDSNDAPQGPRIARMARKSVKSKEIIGFVPTMGKDVVPAPFAMATGRIGMVGRPPAPLNRPPGQPARPKPGVTPITVITTPGVPDAPSIDDENIIAQRDVEHECVDDVLDPISRQQPVPTLKPTIIPEPVQVAEPEPEPEPVQIPRVVNPASRGKKAARKEDAAGSAPQSVVPFEAPLPQAVRVPAKPVVPKKQDEDLPGFSKANGGTWSRHAEDLLGMTRPTGKRS